MRQLVLTWLRSAAAPLEVTTTRWLDLQSQFPVKSWLLIAQNDVSAEADTKGLFPHQSAEVGVVSLYSPYVSVEMMWAGLSIPGESIVCHLYKNDVQTVSARRGRTFQWSKRHLEFWTRGAHVGVNFFFFFPIFVDSVDFRICKHCNWILRGRGHIKKRLLSFQKSGLVFLECLTCDLKQTRSLTRSNQWWEGREMTWKHIQRGWRQGDIAIRYNSTTNAN